MNIKIHEQLFHLGWHNTRTSHTPSLPHLSQSFTNLKDDLQQIWGDDPLALIYLIFKESTNKQSEVSVFTERQSDRQQ